MKIAPKTMLFSRNHVEFKQVLLSQVQKTLSNSKIEFFTTVYRLQKTSEKNTARSQEYNWISAVSKKYIESGCVFLFFILFIF